MPRVVSISLNSTPVCKVDLLFLNVYLMLNSCTLDTAVTFDRYCIIKGLSHPILGNFSFNQLVLELTEISQYRLKTVEELKRNTRNSKRGMHGQNWRTLKRIPLG